MDPQQKQAFILLALFLGAAALVGWLGVVLWRAFISFLN